MVTASGLVPALDFLPTMTNAFDLVESVTGSETTTTPAPDSLPTMTPASVEPVTGSENTKAPASC